MVFCASLTVSVGSGVGVGTGVSVFMSVSAGETSGVSAVPALSLGEEEFAVAVAEVEGEGVTEASALGLHPENVAHIITAHSKIATVRIFPPLSDVFPLKNLFIAKTPKIPKILLSNFITKERLCQCNLTVAYKNFTFPCVLFFCAVCVKKMLKPSLRMTGFFFHFLTHSLRRNGGLFRIFTQYNMHPFAQLFCKKITHLKFGA